jgi:glycosyltransferase involved in cell wall biosynthesis
LKITKTFKPYHTLAVWALPSGVWALFLKWVHGTPYSTWSLGSDIWSYRQNFFTRNLLRLILHEADHRYADGYQLKADVAAIAKKPCDFLATSRSLPIEAEVKTDIKKNKKNYLFIGRYHSNKGPDVLLAAVNELKSASKKKAHFHLFGGGQLTADLKNYIHKHGLGDTVTLNGYIDPAGAAAYLKACNALIIPSRIESIPVVLSDALKAGSRIIATDVGDMGYLLRKYRAGVVVPAESPGKLAQAIEDDMSLPLDNFAQGRRELLKLFDVSEAVVKFVHDHGNDN